MKTQLIKAGLWNNSEKDEPKINISSAWSVLSRLGCPGRFGGRAQDGSYEFVIVNPGTGTLLCSGKGETLESAMCAAALNASQLI